MQRAEVAQRLWDVVEPAAAQSGLELVDVAYQAGRAGMVVRIFVDRKGGVTVAELSRLSRELGDLLDVRAPIGGHYTLEVSSPGINRPLTRPQHFPPFVGRRVRVRTRAPVAGRRNFLGTLLSAAEAEITLELPDGQVVCIPLATVARANYEHDFGSSVRPRSQGGRGARSLANRRRT